MSEAALCQQLRAARLLRQPIPQLLLVVNVTQAHLLHYTGCFLGTWDADAAGSICGGERVAKSARNVGQTAAHLEKPIEGSRQKTHCGREKSTFCDIRCD